MPNQAVTSGKRDIGILVPLEEEFRVLTTLCETAKSESREGMPFHTLNLPNSPYRVVAVVLGGMGPTPAADIAEKMIHHFRPRTLVLVGVAGGIDSDIKLGDVVVAEEISEFLAQTKIVNAAGSFVLKYSGHYWRTDFASKECARNMEFSAEDKGLYRQWRNDAEKYLESLGLTCEQLSLANREPEVRIGPVASGDAVVASSAYKIVLEGINRKFLAIEMEAAGVARAADSREDPLRLVVLRGVSDFADERKKGIDTCAEGVWRRYAMHNAARFLLNLVQTRCFQRIVPPTVSVVHESERRLVRERKSEASTGGDDTAQVLAAIRRALYTGLLDKEDVNIMQETIKDLDPIEFDMVCLFDDPTEFTREHGIDFPSSRATTRSQLLESAIPSLRGQRELYDSYVKRLRTRRLITLETVHTVMSVSDLMQSTTTPLGHKLAQIIKGMRRR